MSDFATMRLPAGPTAVAPDGSDVRVLLRLPGGSMAHFELGAGQVARAVTHRTVDEIWLVVAGRGEMWRKQDGREETVFEFAARRVGRDDILRVSNSHFEMHWCGDLPVAPKSCDCAT